MSEADSILAGINSSRQNAQATAVGAIDDDPEQAGRAIELEKATGVPSAAIYGDVEGFEAQHKAALAGEIVRNNPHIADYINSHPLAAAVSNGDLGQLDTISQALHSLAGNKLLNAPGDIAISAVKGFQEAFDAPGKLGQWAIHPEDQEFAEKYPVLYGNLLHTAQLIGVPGEILNRTISGAIAGFGAAAETGALAVGASPDTARQLKEDIPQMADVAMTMGMVHGGLR